MPTLSNVIIEWFKNELPLSKCEECPRPGRTGTRFTIVKCDRPLFYVTIFKDSILIDNGYLADEFVMSDDRIKTGKWMNYQEVLSSDPRFFSKLTAALAWTAMVITMGEFQCPVL